MNSRQRPPRAKSHSEGQPWPAQSQKDQMAGVQTGESRGAGAAGLSLCVATEDLGRVAWQGLMASRLLP